METETGKRIPKPAKIAVISAAIVLVLVVVCVIIAKNVPVPYRVSIDGEIVPDYTVYRVNGCLFVPVIDTLKEAGYTVHPTDKERCYEVIINDEPYYFDLDDSWVYGKEGNTVASIIGCFGGGPLYVSVPGKKNDLVVNACVSDDLFDRLNLSKRIDIDSTKDTDTKNRVYYFIRYEVESAED